VDALQAAHLFLLGSDAPPSVAAAGLCAVLATLDTVHDLVEKGDAAGVCLDGSLWVLVGGVEEHGFAGELEGACESSSGGGTASVGHGGQTQDRRTASVVCGAPEPVPSCPLKLHYRRRKKSKSTWTRGYLLLDLLLSSLPVLPLACKPALEIPAKLSVLRPTAAAFAYRSVSSFASSSCFFSLICLCIRSSASRSCQQPSAIHTPSQYRQSPFLLPGAAALPSAAPLGWQAPQEAASSP